MSAAAGKFKILISDKLAEQGVVLFKASPEFTVEVKLKLPLEELKKEIADADALVVRSETKVTADVIAAAKKLKIVGRAGVGIDNVDVPAATRRGIVVMNAPEGNTIAAAEHSMALLMALARNIPWAHASLQAGEWARSKFMGHELFGKTLGVVGLGRIGTEVSRRALAFKMRVLACDPVISVDKVKEIGAELVSLETLLKESDFVSLHAPSTPETKKMFGHAQFAMMKKTAWVINCARGSLIDEAALLEALENKVIAGAGLDVFEKEPPAMDSKLLKMPNVVVTPHLGASTEEAQVNVAVVIAEQIRDYLLRGVVRNAVNVPAASPEEMDEIEPYANLAERMGSFLIQIAGGTPKRIAIEYHGEIAAKKLSILTSSAVKGAFSRVSENVNQVNAMHLAKERGVEIAEGKSSEAGDFASLVSMTLTTETGARSIEGTVINRKEPHIVSIDGLHLDIIPTGVMIIYSNVDRPGIVGRVGQILGKSGINIAGLHLGRIAIGKKAVSIFTVDNPVPPGVVEELSALEELSDVRVVNI